MLLEILTILRARYDIDKDTIEIMSDPKQN